MGVMGVSNHFVSIKTETFIHGSLSNAPGMVTYTHNNNICAQKLNRKRTSFNMRFSLHTGILKHPNMLHSLNALLRSNFSWILSTPKT